MAKARSSFDSYSGAIGDVVYYTRFGKTFVRRRTTTIHDCPSPAQLQQRALFKAMQQTSALFGSMLQRGLTTYAHSQGHTEANAFARLNKQCFSCVEGRVHVHYADLQLSRGPLPVIAAKELRVEGLQVQLSFGTVRASAQAAADDVVHLYAVCPQIEVCQPVAAVARGARQATFMLPDFSYEAKQGTPLTIYLYAIVEAAGTAAIPTLSADEKRSHKQHRNINRVVSNTVYIGSIVL